MTNLAQILKEELLDFYKKIPEEIDFVYSVLSSKEKLSGVDIDALLSLYNKCTRFLILSDLYKKVDPKFIQQKNFQNLEREVTECREEFRKIIVKF